MAGITRRRKRKIARIMDKEPLVADTGFIVLEVRFG